MHDVDLNSQPPSSLGMGPHRPIETQEGTDWSRRATVAQQLYASSISPSQASTPSTSLWTDGVASSSDAPSPVPRTSPSLDLLLSSRPRPMTDNEDNGPQPVFKPDIIAPFTANAFYHHSVGPPLYTSRTSSADVLGTNLRPTLLAPSVPEKDYYPKPCFDTPSSPPPHTHPGYFPNRNLYTATTEDNLMVIPTRTTDQAPNGNRMAPIDVSCLSDSQPIPSDRFHNARNISALNNQHIIQPKPTRPFNGVSLNLQDQVAEDVPILESVKQVKAKRKFHLKNFGLGASKNPFSKGRMVASTGRDEETTDDCQDIALNSDRDESFVFVAT